MELSEADKEKLISVNADLETARILRKEKKYEEAADLYSNVLTSM